MIDTTNSAADRAQGLLCPACRVDLVMGERQGVEIDYCPKCRGVWLDRGELDRIVERSVSSEAGAGKAQPAPQQGQQQPQGYYGGSHGSGLGGGHHGGRRHGLFGRLFD